MITCACCGEHTPAQDSTSGICPRCWILMRGATEEGTNSRAIVHVGPYLAGTPGPARGHLTMREYSELEYPDVNDGFWSIENLATLLWAEEAMWCEPS